MTYSIDDLLHLMTRLRDPQTGCPWDVKQTYETIVSSTIEEAYEVADTIERGNFTHLKEELGDLLFQVIFYSQLGKEDGRFTFEGVVDGLVTKLIQRHPHVFPAGTLESIPDDSLDDDSIRGQWEALKKAERTQKGQTCLLADIPAALPALTRATKLQKRAASVGFDWSDIHGPIAKVAEELDEVRAAVEEGDADHIAEEIGDLLFAVVNISRSLKLDAETLLRRANRKFERRFEYIETMLGDELDSASLQKMDALWDEAKTKGIK